MPRVSVSDIVISMNDEALTLNEAVASQLRGELAAKDWTLADLSAASGIPKVSVQRYLRGTRPIDIAILDRLARALGLSVVDVFVMAEARLEREARQSPEANAQGA